MATKQITLTVNKSTYESIRKHAEKSRGAKSLTQRLNEMIENAIRGRYPAGPKV